jgi:hypothetical protein
MRTYLLVVFAIPHIMPCYVYEEPLTVPRLTC